MHIDTLEDWQHYHNFNVDYQDGENNTKKVMALTAITMVVEVVAGMAFGSMALLADGWHMMTHVAAFGITLFAYQYSRRHAQNSKYTFGTGKVNILGGFASAIALGVVAFVMAIESMARIFEPHVIYFNQAIIVAIIGLTINIISGWLLKEDHHHHDHHHEDHHHHDHNLRAAYFHVLADALTSVLAIMALLAGKYFDWLWMDALMGIVGSLVIAKWSLGLMKDTSSILLDEAVDKEIRFAITNAIESDSDNRITDLHVWYVSQEHLVTTISLVTHYPKSSEYYKNLLSHLPQLSHITIEVNHCHGKPCIPVVS